MTKLDDMTHEQAKAEAVRRWGPSGRALLRHSFNGKRTTPGRLAPYRYSVGKQGTIYGQGHTWREAFADAAARTHVHG